MKSTDAVATIDRLRLESWHVDRLIPSARNARTHSDAQIAEIAASIRAFGFSNPVLVGEDGDIIAGHGRLAAARQLGLTEVPVIVLSGLTDLQRRQLMLADNRISLNAGWDFEMLHLELKDLAVLGADLAVFWRIVLCYRLGTQEVWQRLTWIQNNSGLPQGLARPSAAG